MRSTMGTDTRPIACPASIASVRCLPNRVEPETYRHKEDHAANAEDATNVVDLFEHLPARHAHTIHTRWRKVEDRGHGETDEIPDAAEQADPSPGAMRRDELAPEDGRAEGDDGEDEDGDVFSTLGGRRKLGGDGERGELVDSGTDTREDHAADEHVHLVRGGTNDHPDQDEAGSHDRDVSSPYQVGDAADEGTDGRE